MSTVTARRASLGPSVGRAIPREPPAPPPVPETPLAPAEGLPRRAALPRAFAGAGGLRDRAVSAVLLGASAVGAIVGAPTLARAEPAPDPSAPVVPGSILGEPGGRRVDPVFELLGFPSDRSPRVDDRGVVSDPNTVVVKNTDRSGDAKIHDIVTRRLGAPRTAELVAKTLAERYGPFNAANSEANRRAILENLRWIGDSDTGIVYDDARAESGTDPTTQSPNTTLSNRSGVCRDTHTAIAAILASLADARFDGKTWVPGSPDGTSHAQVFAFANPTEFHAYLVYRNPATGGWNALEYGKSYDLEAPTAVDAFRALPGYVSSYQTYRLAGWDGKPRLVDGHALGAAKARAFFEADPGTGRAGETRLVAGADGARVVHFVTPHLSVVGGVDAGATATPDGGLKLNYHRDLRGLDGRGYVRAGAGVYTSELRASKDTGSRGAAARHDYRVYVLGLKLDGRYERAPYRLLGEHLQLKLGGDLDGMLGLPFASGPEADSFVRGDVFGRSTLKVGVDGTVIGHERLAERLSLDWALRARYEPDLLEAGAELQGSEGGSASALGTAALRADFAIALTHRSERWTTRLEAGGSYFAEPFDPAVTPRGLHHAVLTVSPRSGDLQLAILARGETLDGAVDPVDSLGVALTLRPTKRLSVGAGATVDPGAAGVDVSVRGRVGLEF